MNFIADFLKNKLEKKNIKTNNNFWMLDKWIRKKIEIKDNIYSKIENKWRSIENIKKLIRKMLGWYLWNNSNLDNTFKNMNINEMKKDLDNGEKAVKPVRKYWKKHIKFEKQKPYKNLLWIFFQFLIWIILIFASAIHINANVAEYKFIKSSIDLWTNTFNSLVSNLGWIVWENAKDTYIEKRKLFVSSLIDLQDKLKSCNKEWQNEIKNKIINLKTKLMDTDYITLQEFIDNYDQYKIAIDSISESVNSLCNSNNYQIK